MKHKLFLAYFFLYKYILIMYELKLFLLFTNAFIGISDSLISNEVFY